MADYQAARDDLALGLFAASDEIASFNWDLERLKVLHLFMSEQMSREVTALVQLEGESSRTRRGAGGMSDEGRAWAGKPPKVGDRAQRTREVAARDIELFTEISGDRNPLHYNEAAGARASKFGRIIVQGGVTSAILNAVVAEDLPGPGTVFLNVSWSFKAPVRPGDTITGAVEVLEVRTDKPICKLKTTVTRDDGVVALEGEALCYTLPLSPAAD